MHEPLHHFVALAEWSDQASLAVVRSAVLPSIEHHSPIEAWIIDDTGSPKKSEHSFGADHLGHTPFSRQYLEAELGR